MPTIDEMNKICEEISGLRTHVAEIGKEKKHAQLELDEKEAQLLQWMQDAGMHSYASPAGKFGLSARTSVKTPKTPDDRAAFFTWLRERGLFDQMITVNSQTLNALYKNELEQAQASGADDVTIPGINEIKINTILSFRRAG